MNNWTIEKSPNSRQYPFKIWKHQGEKSILIAGISNIDDAILFNAAPDIQLALKTMFNSWVVRPDDEVNIAIYTLAKNALAKAEGKA